MLTGIIGAGVLAWGTTAVEKNRKGAGQVQP
jgi:hypothetical protein